MVHEANLSSNEEYQARCLYCYICGTTIDRKYAEDPAGEESWRAYAQELTLKDPQAGAGPLVDPELCPLVIRGEPRRVHQACSAVVSDVVGGGAFTAAQLDGFIDCARDIDPFLPQIPTGASPDRLDTDLASPGLDLERRESMDPVQATWYDDQILQSEGIRAPVLTSIAKHDVPLRLEDLVSEALDPDFHASKYPDAGIQNFLAAARTLQSLPPLRDQPPDERPISIAQALWNFKKGGVARFPHTANFDVVRSNVLTILTKLLPMDLEDVSSAHYMDGIRPKLEEYRSISAGCSASPALTLRLFTLRRNFYARDETDDEDGRRLGSQYLRDVGFATGDPEVDLEATLELAVDSPHGLEFVRDGLGVVRVNVKDSAGWRTAFAREGITGWDDKERFPRAKVEWMTGSEEQFHIISDVSTPVLPVAGSLG